MSADLPTKSDIVTHLNIMAQHYEVVQGYFEQLGMSRWEFDKAQLGSFIELRHNSEFFERILPPAQQELFPHGVG
jgi:hypothetical protein